MAGKAIPMADRFWQHSIPEPNSGCFLWLSATIKSGGALLYGVVQKEKPEKGNALAHRIAYELTKGSIPAKLQVDHTCNNSLCVNPDHLELVTAPEHHLRTHFRRYGNACRKGHAFTAENTWIEKTGARHCRRCHADSTQRQRDKRKKENN